MQLPSHFIILILSLVPLVSSQDQAHCNSLLTCDKCISSPLFSCSWCGSKAYAEQYYPSCDTFTSLKDRGCPEVDITTGDSYISASGSSLAVSPTKVVATVSPNVRKSFEIKVSPPPPEEYPVDIYMLFDNTRSMRPYIDIATQMAVALLNLTSNASNVSRVGFGTFVEKETIPFHFGLDEDGDFPGVSHSYRNILPLTSDSNSVKGLVNQISLGTNDDQPENVLEAILQSVLCQEEIQWRELFKSFRMIVLMTDSEFHYALDGRLAGIVVPNNLQCSLEQGTYVNSSAQDYPSILQFLTEVLIENILPVIITDGDYRDLYEELFSIIGIENTTLILTTDLNQLLNTIEEIYLTASTRSHPVILPENDVIQYELSVVDCGGGQLVAETQSCLGIPRNSSATYKLEVWLTPEQACSFGHSHPHSLDVRFQGFGVVNVTLYPFCECPCSLLPEKNSGKCSFSGDLTCGVCECAAGYSGPNCECQVNASRTCVEPGSGVVCSNKGSCVCDECICDNPETSGEYCHCDDTLCPVYSGEVCGGAEKGTCSCQGTCTCTPQYEDGTQGQCSCLKSETTAAELGCTDPENFLNGLCNGFGTCECGQCVCDAGADIEDPDYYGVYCEICNVCEKSCALLRPCLSCLLSTGSNKCCSGLPGESLLLSMNVTQLALLRNDPAYRTCHLFDQSGCFWEYVILSKYTGNEEDIGVIARRRTCDSPTWWPWIVAAFFIVVFVGVVVIIVIRLCVWIVERKEFKTFWNSQKGNLPFTNSPLYLPPVTEVDNPTYKKMESKPVE